MDVFPVGIDEVVSPSTSVFDALCTLHPLSPILTPSQLTFAWSSGDIPVLLYDENYVEGSSELCDSATFTSCMRDSWACIDSPVSEGTAGVPRTEFQSGSLESSSTLSSVGTFGPRNRRRTLRASDYLQRPSHKNIGSSSLSQKCDGPSTKASSTTSRVSLEETCASPNSMSEVFYHPIVFVEGNQALSRSTRNSAAFESSEPELISQPTSEDSSDDESQQPVDKSVSWISPRSWDYIQYKDFIGNQGLSPHPPLVQALQDLGYVECEEFLPSFPFVEKEKETDSPEQSLGRSVNLSLDWLNDIYLDFLIDQEGFRAAHPLFRFTGNVRQRWRVSACNVMAQFKPVVRQTFHFHYAPFESPPILRRITVNGDDTHDYVSRQGLLFLKTNGVYVLHGQELPTGSHHYDSEVVKLQWQFEYLVDDRVADSSRKIMEGEKTLTPLTFSCSPALLFPSQAKKNSIIHVFKKGMAQKLHAEKLQPPVQAVPGPASSSAKGLQLHSLGLPFAETNPPDFSKLQGRRPSHRRGKSHNIRDTEAAAKVKDADYPKDRAVPNLAENASKSPVRLRRNSSAGEHDDSPIRPQVHAVRPSTCGKERHEGALDVVQLTARHIIPPKKLRQLFNNSDEELINVYPPTNPHRDSNYISP